MANETVNVREAFEGLKERVGEKVLEKCLELLRKCDPPVGQDDEMAVDAFLEVLHQAEDLVHQAEIEETIYSQNLGFNSDP